MTIVVPFDGTPLSEAALRRGSDLGDAFGERLVAISVIPKGNERYAREQGWIAETERFDMETVLDRLEEQVDRIAPDAKFEYDVVSRYAQPGEIASPIRKRASDLDTDIVVLGSDNAGRIVTSVSSVAGPVAADDAYDVMIVRHTDE